MENASKALLIAGAVLIVILIIGVGMAIYSGAQGSINSAISQMSAQEQQIFNAQFTGYEGTQSGSKVKNLITTVISNNAQSNTEGTPTVSITINKNQTDTNKQITTPSITGGTAWNNTNGEKQESLLSKLKTDITSSKDYKISFTQSNGVISIIDISIK